MENLATILSIILSSLSVIATIAGVYSRIRKIAEGQKCLLRSRLLEIYYRHREERSMQQYEYEDFSDLYSAYKALHGNSFTDKIKHEIDTDWEVKR